MRVFKLLLKSLVVLPIVIFATSTFAQPFYGVNVLNDIKIKLEQFHKDWLDVNYEPPTLVTNYLIQTMLANTTYRNMLRSTQPQTIKLSNNALNAIANTFEPEKVFTRIGSRGFDMNEVSMNSLLGKSVYSDNGSAAKEFISYVTGQANPISTQIIPPEDVKGNKKFAEYNVAVREYTASQSVGLSNLYEMLAKRLPTIPVERGFRGIRTQNGKVSARQLEEYLAERRTLDPEWYSLMTEASPASVARETLFVLAEMRLEMYKTRLAIERLTAVNSIQQVQSSRAKSRQEINKLTQQISQ